MGSIPVAGANFFIFSLHNRFIDTRFACINNPFLFLYIGSIPVAGAKIQLHFLLRTWFIDTRFACIS